MHSQMYLKLGFVMNIRKEIIEMTIQELKTEIKENVDDYVTTEGKKAFLRWVVGTVLPAVKEVGKSYADSVKESTDIGASGWVKFRDAMLIPSLISGSMWCLEKLINRALEAE